VEGALKRKKTRRTSLQPNHPQSGLGQWPPPWVYVEWVGGHACRRGGKESCGGKIGVDARFNEGEENRGANEGRGEMLLDACGGKFLTQAAENTAPLGWEGGEKRKDWTSSQL
jgi:hypothetical protein